jgi:hypothetical protein
VRRERRRVAPGAACVNVNGSGGAPRCDLSHEGPAP